MSPPQINAETCLPAVHAASACAACIDVCPHEALQASEDLIALDADACSGCGACAAACPVGAITLEGAEAPAPLDRPGAAGWLVCPRRPRADRHAICVRSLGPSALARLWLSGLRRLNCITAGCADCPDGAGLDVEAVATRFNDLLASRGLPELHLTHATAPPAGAVRIAPAESADIPARRRIFGLAAATQAPSGPPLARLQALVSGEGALYAFVPQIDPLRCTGCDGCVRICPTGSLSLIKDENDVLSYEVLPSSCNGCRLCSDMCASDAIEIATVVQLPAPVALRSYRCRGCGVEVHEPEARPQNAYCPVCRQTGHHRKLFLVLE